MNLLPPELQVSILQNLPGTDVKRMEGLNKYFSSLIRSNQKFLSKPTVSLKIGGYYKDWELCFTVIYGKVIMPCYILEDGKIKLSKRPPGAKRFMMCFYEFAQKQPYGCLQKNLFFKWLLKTFDLEFFEIYPTEKSDDVADLFIEAMEERRFKCPKVCLNRGFCISDELNPWITMFQTLCDQQRKLGIETQLVISDENGSPFYQIREFICIDLIRNFTKWFDDVLCEYNYDTLIATLYAICSRWNRGFPDAGFFSIFPNAILGNNDSRFSVTPLDYLNFRVRIFYDKKKESVETRTKIRNIHQFFNLNQTLVNLTEGEFVDLLNFDSFDRLPEEIVCRRIPDGKIMKFKLSKEEASFVLTMEFD